MDSWIIILILAIIVIACIAGVLYYIVHSFIDFELNFDEDDIEE